MTTDIATIDAKWAWAAFEPDAKRPWNRSAAAHLYRRAEFAATSQELDAAVKQAPESVVKSLVAGKTDAGFEREVEQLKRSLLASGSVENLSAWWLYRMIHGPDPLLEKLTLFWHGHFATSGAKVNRAAAMIDQHELLRKHARGKFADMVQGISRDPAMLIYLDSTTNRKVHPNENYAREVMELFCLGPGNYMEKDIQQAARAFTGWEVRRGQFQFNPIQHDNGSKTVLGKSGNFDGDDIVRIVLAQPAAARFIAGKLVRFYVCDEPPLPDRLIEPLAEQLRENGFTIVPVVERILGSRLFFSEHAVAQKVRSPVELAVGLLRALDGRTNVLELAKDLEKLGQAVFFPPNVKGWDGGRLWINSSTLVGRANLVERLLNHGDTKLAPKLTALADRHGAKSAEQTVDWLLQLLVAVPVTGEVRRRLIEIAGDSRGDSNRRIAEVVHVISTLPEFHLA